MDGTQEMNPQPEQPTIKSVIVGRVERDPARPEIVTGAKITLDLYIDDQGFVHTKEAEMVLANQAIAETRTGR